jgi:hypothetical protein
MVSDQEITAGLANSSSKIAKLVIDKSTEKQLAKLNEIQNRVPQKRQRGFSTPRDALLDIINII